MLEYKKNKNCWYSLLSFSLLVLPGISLAASQMSPFEVVMNKNGFEPASLSIKQGDVVIFVNEDSQERWPASNIHPTHRAYPGTDIRKCKSESDSEDMFDACGPVQIGKSYSFQFKEVGQWNYHDHIEAEFRGQILVSAADDYISAKKTDSLMHKKPLVIKIKNLFYSFFPSLLEKRLKKLDVLAVANDEDQLLYWLQLIRPSEFMQLVLERTDGGSTIDCHAEAHDVGRVAYQIYGSSVLAEGDASCHSGFYHGAIEMFIAENGINDIERDTQNLCDDFSTRFGNFECLHGVGHGIMAYVGYDLPNAIEFCKLLEDDYSSSSCLGGVFMENVVAGQWLGAIDGHETLWLNNSDPYYPCNALPASFDVQTQCYLMQTSWMLVISDYDFEIVSQWCSEVSDSVRRVCYASFGRDIAGYTLRDADAILELCEFAPSKDGAYQDCIFGAQNVIIDFWGETLTNQALDLCVKIEDAITKEACLNNLEGRMSDFENKPEQDRKPSLKGKIEVFE